MWDVLIRFMMRFLLHSFAAARPTEVTIATFVLKQRPPPLPAPQLPIWLEWVGWEPGKGGRSQR